MLAAAGTLQPDERRDPARVRAAKEAMLRAYAHAQNPPEARDDAGTDDGLEEPEIHRQEIDLPGGGQLVLSDIEAITPERAEATRARIARILQGSEERDRLS
ncbi:hypothetical protein G3I60_05455 [Streptomyces sp. SID13666]|uniref:hypothetical protein n=1 Tax=Streptomyces sp. SID13666 TaxID=2706054 RepID=UPI0013C16B92|nr:hypothetical protein [Streptomyces sp. SID13666]NEA53617.1 hypothetical protein [Streptomyces sp. SID13666]